MYAVADWMPIINWEFSGGAKQHSYYRFILTRILWRIQISILGKAPQEPLNIMVKNYRANLGQAHPKFPIAY